MDEIQWLQVAISFFCGGAFGTLLKIGYDLYRDRQQPVFFRVEKDRIFDFTRERSSLTAKVTVEHGNQPFTYSNLAMVKVVVVNRGHTDIGEFDYGVTLPEGHNIVLADVSSDDRHHVMAVVNAPAPDKPAREIDLRCKPFNRNDKYVARLYVHSDNETIKEEQVKLSTPASVRFVTSNVDELQFRRELADLVAKAVAGILMLMVMPLVLKLLLSVFSFSLPDMPKRSPSTEPPKSAVTPKDE